ncbi:MAG: hypothetical protein EB082_17535, partial [Verrucomicrobia bacterium]|nr:hypothetical protein [Verrucomicrobiota bacterium]
MVKNNEKQHQRFKLPAGANFWGCYVNNQPSKAERDGDWLQIPLPRGENRDEAFAVDIVYAQKLAALDKWLPQHVALTAPATDVPNTYAEWQLFVPATKRVSSFGGTMTEARGTTYGLREAWDRFLLWWEDVWSQLLGGLAFLAVVYFIVRSVKVNGMKGFGTAAVVLFVCAIIASMMLPALSKAKAKAGRIKSANNLKQIGLAAKIFANDNAGRFPDNFEEMMNELGSDKILTDPETGERYVWTGAGKPEHPDSVLAFTPVDVEGHRNAVFGDGSVQQMTSSAFAQALQKDAQIVAQSSVRRAQGVGMAQDAQALAMKTPKNVTPISGAGAVGGDFSNMNGTPRNRIARLNVDGSVDTTFSNSLVATRRLEFAKQADQPAKPQELRAEMEQLADMDKKLAQREKSESLARVDHLSAERKASSGPMPMTPPPAAMPAPPLDPMGNPIAATTKPSAPPDFGAAVYGVRVLDSQTTNQTVSVNFATANGTAVTGNDYVAGAVTDRRGGLTGTANASGAFQLGMLAAGGVGGGGAPGGGPGFASVAGEAAQWAALLVWLAWKFWPRKTDAGGQIPDAGLAPAVAPVTSSAAVSEATRGSDSDKGSGSAPPTVASIVLLLLALQFALCAQSSSSIQHPASSI